MKSQHDALHELGWNDWFEQQVARNLTGTVARVTAVDRGQLLLLDQSGHFRAKLSGSYLHHHEVAQQLPCVGDWVCVERQRSDGFGVIHTLLERKTSLCRKSVGNSIEHQMIAANLDYAVVVQSCVFDFNINRLERCLFMVRDGGAEPYILLTKTDLVDPTVLAAQVAEIASAGITAPLLPLSSVTGNGLDNFKRLLSPGKTYCFLGASGVGKSTLINQLIGSQRLETGAVSGTGEGKHTTVRRELIRLEGGALVIDNPGMREFGIISAENSGVADDDSSISALSANCRYRNCGHTDEPGCAVLAAKRAGEISPESLRNFHKLRAESNVNAMSYAEKRKKNQGLGRYVKSGRKGLKNG